MRRNILLLTTLFGTAFWAAETHAVVEIPEPQYCSAPQAQQDCVDCGASARGTDVVPGVGDVSAFLSHQRRDATAEELKDRIKEISLKQNISAKARMLQLFPSEYQKLRRRGTGQKPLYYSSVVPKESPAGFQGLGTSALTGERRVDSCLGPKKAQPEAGNLRAMMDFADEKVREYHASEDAETKAKQREKFLKEYFVAALKAEEMIGMVPGFESARKLHEDEIKDLAKNFEKAQSRCGGGASRTDCNRARELQSALDARKTNYSRWQEQTERTLAPLGQLQHEFPMLFEVRSGKIKGSGVLKDIVSRVKSKYPELYRQARGGRTYDSVRPRHPTESPIEFTNACNKKMPERDVETLYDRPYLEPQLAHKKYWEDVPVQVRDLDWLYERMQRSDGVEKVVAVLDESTQAICETDGANVYQNPGRSEAAMLEMMGELDSEEARNQKLAELQAAHCQLFKKYPPARFSRHLAIGGGLFLAGAVVAGFATGGLGFLALPAVQVAFFGAGGAFAAMGAVDTMKSSQYLRGLRGTAYGSSCRVTSEELRQATSTHRLNAAMTVADLGPFAALDIASVAHSLRLAKIARTADAGLDAVEAGTRAATRAQRTLERTAAVAADVEPRVLDNAARSARAGQNQAIEAIEAMAELDHLNHAQMDRLIKVVSDESLPSSARVAAARVLDGAKAGDRSARESLRSYRSGQIADLKAVAEGAADPHVLSRLHAAGDFVPRNKSELDELSKALESSTTDSGRRTLLAAIRRAPESVAKKAAAQVDRRVLSSYSKNSDSILKNPELATEYERYLQGVDAAANSAIATQKGAALEALDAARWRALSAQVPSGARQRNVSRLRSALAADFGEEGAKVFGETEILEPANVALHVLTAPPTTSLKYGDEILVGRGLPVDEALEDVKVALQRGCDLK